MVEFVLVARIAIHSSRPSVTTTLAMPRPTTSSPFRTLASTLAVLVLTGCAEMRLPRIDPSGEHLFVCDSRPVSPPPAAACPPGTVAAPVPAAIPAAPGGIQPIPVAQPGVAPLVSPYVDAAVTLAPCNRVMPVGAEVILVAGVRGGDNYLRTNRRLDWAILPGGVGQFTDIGKKHFEDFLVGDFARPRIVSTVSAVGSTTRIAEGAGQGGRIYVARGEGWIALRSPVEGVSRVTVAAPSVVVPAERAKTATIYWYDAQYSFPEPVVTPPGSKGSLATTVWKLTNRCPLPGWIVRYELAGGPQAIFAPSGTTAVEVPTDAAGRASVEIVQKDPSPGTSQIRVQLFHPADQCNPRYLVRDGCTAVSWSDSKAPAVMPPGVVLPGPVSTPPPAPTERPATIPPPVASSTPAAVSILEVRVTPRTTAIVGSNVTFSVEITNRGPTTASGVNVSDTYDVGLVPQTNEPIQDPLSTKPIGWKAGDLAPGATLQRSITFRVTKPGRLCHRVEAIAADGGRMFADSCVTAEPPATETPRPAPPAPVSPVVPAPGSVNVNPPPVAPAAMPLEVRVAAQPPTATVGQKVMFTATIHNRTQQPLANVTVSQQADSMLALTQYLEGGNQRGAECVWNLPAVLPNQDATIRVQCECVQASPRACCRFVVKLADGRSAEWQACIEILAAPKPRVETGPATVPATPGRLTVKIDNRNIVTAGKDQQFLVFVTNDGDAAESDIVVTAQLPPESSLVRPQTAGPDAGITFQEQAGQLRFDPIVLPPKKTKVYRITVTTVRAGTITLQAEATGRRQLQPAHDSKSVEVTSE
jgi:uncharacterized repeat protein (TIGR01451 family)